MLTQRPLVNYSPIRFSHFEQRSRYVRSYILTVSCLNLKVASLVSEINNNQSRKKNLGQYRFFDEMAFFIISMNFQAVYSCELIILDVNSRIISLVVVLA